MVNQSEIDVFNEFLIIMVIIAITVLIVLFVVPAGYGQLIREKWGKPINNKVGWFVMEVPVVVLFLIYWLLSPRRFQVTPLIFVMLFNLHYLQRTFIFPLLIRGKDLMPWSIILFGIVFNTTNAYMQGAWIFVLSEPRIILCSVVVDPPVHYWRSYLSRGVHGQYPQQPHHPQPPDTGGHRFSRPLWRNVPIRDLCELFWRARRVGRVGLMTGRGRVSCSMIWTFCNLGPRV